MKLTNKKIIISGSIIESYKYEESISYDYQSATKGSTRCEQKEKKEQETRDDSLSRSKQTLRRLINSNIEVWKNESGKLEPPIFLTLTFAENIQNLKIANGLFSKFIKRLNYQITSKKKSFLKYAVVIEFQKRGAVHYHAIFFNLKYIENNTLASWWKHGFIKINKITNLYNAGTYMTKYMSKKFADSRLTGRKRYFTSKNLKKPLIIKNENSANKIYKSLPKKLLVYEKEFYTDYQGKIEYKLFNLEKRKVVFDEFNEFKIID